MLRIAFGWLVKTWLVYIFHSIVSNTKYINFICIYSGNSQIVKSFWKQRPVQNNYFCIFFFRWPLKLNGQKLEKAMDLIFGASGTWNTSFHTNVAKSIYTNMAGERTCSIFVCVIHALYSLALKENTIFNGNYLINGREQYFNRF